MPAARTATQADPGRRAGRAYAAAVEKGETRWFPQLAAAPGGLSSRPLPPPGSELASPGSRWPRREAQARRERHPRTRRRRPRPRARQRHRPRPAARPGRPPAGRPALITARTWAVVPARPGRAPRRARSPGSLARGKPPPPCQCRAVPCGSSPWLRGTALLQALPFCGAGRRGGQVSMRDGSSSVAPLTMKSRRGATSVPISRSNMSLAASASSIRIRRSIRRRGSIVVSAS